MAMKVLVYVPLPPSNSPTNSTNPPTDPGNIRYPIVECRIFTSSGPRINRKALRIEQARRDAEAREKLKGKT
jgi:hypothetical protein